MTYFYCASWVHDAVRERRPVVALETAVLTHGLPRDLAVAAYGEIVAAVEAQGALPAPVGVIDGTLTLGLTEGQWRALSSRDGVVKAGIADLPPLAATGGWAGTTVGATLLAAARGGVPVFATGGIGGVHRGAAESFDVSGDLAALSRFGGCVVCSGAKNLLNLPKTMEVLETLGVPVVGYRTAQLPAFTVTRSGIALRHRVESPEQAATMLLARDALGLTQSVVLVQPPPEGQALPEALAREALEASLAETQGVSGAGVTPAVLAKLNERTAGASLRANRALLVENARLAARVALALSHRPGADDRPPDGGP